MLAYGQRLNRHRVDIAGLAEYWPDRIEHLLRRCVDTRKLLPESCSLDSSFDQFMADDMAMVENIYAKASLELTAKARAEMQQFIDEHPRGKHGQMQYNLKEDFGIDPAVLRERFRFYFDAFPVKAEAK